MLVIDETYKAVLWTKDGEAGANCMLGQLDDLGVWAWVDGSDEDKITFVPWHNVLAIEVHRDVMKALSEEE